MCNTTTIDRSPWLYHRTIKQRHTDCYTDLATARKILGSDAIIGVTVCTIEEAQLACEGGADYLGIGTVYSTQTYASHLFRSVCSFGQ